MRSHDLSQADRLPELKKEWILRKTYSTSGTRSTNAEDCTDTLGFLSVRHWMIHPCPLLRMISLSKPSTTVPLTF